MSFAGDGDEALLMANEKRPDLILLDMTILSGLTVEADSSSIASTAR
jgi:CheY-like chemotaxis protein